MVKPSRWNSTPGVLVNLRTTRARPGAKLLVAAADDDHLRRAGELRECLDDVLDRANPEPSRRDQDREQVLVKAVLAPHRLGIFGFREDRVDGNARDGDLALRHAQRQQVDLRFLQSHEVMVGVAAEPHGVNVEVGHDHGVQDVHLLFRLEPRDDLGRQKVGADRNVGLILIQEIDEWNRVQPVERQAEFFVPARDIEMVVEPAQNLGRLVDQVDVRLGIEVAKDVVGVFEHVQVLDLGGQSPDPAGPSRSRRLRGDAPPRRWRKEPVHVPASRASRGHGYD